MKDTPSRFEAAIAAELRAQFGRTELPRDEAAAVIGVHPATLARKLKGRIGITMDELDTLAKYLGTTFEKVIESARAAAPGDKS